MKMPYGKITDCKSGKWITVDLSEVPKKEYGNIAVQQFYELGYFEV